jgi:hypothetical protein
MSCPPFTYNPVTPDHWESIKTKAASAGFQLTGNGGNLEINTPIGAVEGSYEYDPATQMLVVKITSKPMFAPCSMIEDRLNGLVKS